MSEFPKYKLTDKQIRGIANIVAHEQGTEAGRYAEASQIANRTDIKGNQYATPENAVKTVKSGWYAHGRARYEAGTTNKQSIQIVKNVFCKGFRTLPRYIDEHDCMSDIATVKTGTKNVKSDKSKWEKHKTVIRNKMSSKYYFYSFPGGYKTGVDPFGYTSKEMRKKWGDFCYTVAQAKKGEEKTLGNKTLLKKLNQYHAYIKAHSKYFYNKYDGKMTTFGKAKAKVEKKQKVGLTCVVALRWALAYMGIKGKGGKSLISAPKGSFASYYTGDVKKYLTRIKKGGPVGMTPKQAIDKGLLDPGDIVCYKGRTHTSVYVGGYMFIEGGGTCSKNGHYPNGIKVNYSKGFYADKKISEVLRWKNQDYVKPKNKKAYTGKLPTFSKERSYYKRGDGIDTLVSCRDQIKIMQKCLNWALSGTNGFEKLKEDGLLGNASRAAILKFRKIYKLSEKAAWTAECNAKMKVIKK